MNKLVHFDASNNYLFGAIDFTNINETSNLNHINLLNNSYNSTQFLDGTDDYVNFDALSQLESNRNITIKIDTIMQCDLDMDGFCQYSSYSPVNRLDDTCFNYNNCLQSCGNCVSTCSYLSMTFDTIKICHIFEHLDGFLWYEWNQKDYCNVDLFNDSIGCDSLNRTISINFSNFSLSGQLSFAPNDSIYANGNYTLPDRLESLNLANNDIEGTFDLDALCGDSGTDCEYMRSLDTSYNNFNGTFDNHAENLATLNISYNEFDYFIRGVGTPSIFKVNNNRLRRTFCKFFFCAFVFFFVVFDTKLLI